MSESALIGSASPMGRAWASSRFFDYLAESTDLFFPQSKLYDLIALIDPVFWKAPMMVRRDVETAKEVSLATKSLLHRLPDFKSDRFVFITTAELLPENGDENSPMVDPEGDPYLAERAGLYALVNRQFGRVLNIFVPEWALADPAYSVLGTLKNPPLKGKLPLAALQRHQLYPPERLEADIRKLFPLGVSRFVAAMPPVTTDELTEKLAPALVKRLPDFSSNDPLGSNRSCCNSFHWLDPKSGYLVTPEEQWEMLQSLMDAHVE